MKSFSPVSFHFLKNISRSFKRLSIDYVMVNGLIVLICLVSLSGCGALTGIPGHGGGKRFAIEQELVATSTRATIKQIDLSTIKGKKVNLFINAIGDKGAGNLLGGRFSVVSQLRGNYIQSPLVTEKYSYPRYTSTTTSASKTDSSSKTDSASTITSSSNTSKTYEVSSTSTLLPSPELKEIQEKGGGKNLQLGVEYKGLGAYHNSEEISSDDLQYLSGLFQTYLFLQGVYVVPPSEAEVDVYIIVDVFGTVRTRVDWFLANNEILKAKTVLEVMAVDHKSGELVMSPQAVGAETEYNEQYVLWAGPIIIKKLLRQTDPLMSTFIDLTLEQKMPELKQRDESIPYPFRHQIKMMMEDDE